jgi:ribosomal protein S18 acetylase RimI-like enzyme
MMQPRIVGPRSGPEQERAMVQRREQAAQIETRAAAPRSAAPAARREDGEGDVERASARGHDIANLRVDDPKAAAAAPGSANPAMVVRPSAGGFHVAATAGGQVKGSVRLREHGPKTIEMTDLAVDPAHRGRGLGRDLLASAARTGQRLGKTGVALSSEDNGSGRLTRWYRDLGFVQNGRDARGDARLEAPISRVLGNAGVVQRSAAPNSFANFTTSSMAKHSSDIKKGADQVALPLYALNPAAGPKAKAQALILPTIDVAGRDDEEFAQLSLENFENQMWKLTMAMQKRVTAGKSISSHLAKQTEVIGEFAAFNGFAKKYPKYQMAFAADPGHGTGIDQLWKMYNTDGSVNTYMIVEAKGPKAKGKDDQMSQAWVASRMASLSHSSDATVATEGAAVVVALAGAGDGKAVAYVKGCICRARYDEKSGSLTYSVSKSTDYN